MGICNEIERHAWAFGDVDCETVWKHLDVRLVAAADIESLFVRCVLLQKLFQTRSRDLARDAECVDERHMRMLSEKWSRRRELNP